MSPTPEQIAKLPQWAQQHIAKLTSDVEYHRQRLILDADSRIVVDPYDDEPRYLHDKSRLRFVLTPGGGANRRWDTVIDVHLDGDELVLNTGGDYLLILPGSSGSATARTMTPVQMKEAGWR